MSDKELTKKYEEIMHKRLFNAYLNGEIIKEDEVFSDADLYGVEKSEIALFCTEFNDSIKKCELYLRRLVEKKAHYLFLETEIKEYHDYGMVLGFTSKELEEIHKYYVKNNNIVNKEKMLKILFESYRTGDILDSDYKEDVDERINRIQLSNEEQKEVKKYFEMNCSKVSSLLDDIYANKQDDLLLSETEIQKLRECLISLFRYDISEIETREFIRSLDIMTGKYEERARSYGASLEKKLTEQFGTMTIEWEGVDVVLDGKYLFEKYLSDEYNRIFSEFDARYKDIAKNRSDTLSYCRAWVNDFEKTLTEWFVSLEKCLKYPTKEYWLAVQRNAERARRNIEHDEGIIENIDKQQNDARRYRQNRKDSRARWVGGGFGVGGAIKGAVTAGAMNFASGVVHSVVNTAGNALTAGVSNYQRRSAVNSPDYVQMLMYNSLKNNFRWLFNSIQKDTNHLLPELDYLKEYKFYKLLNNEKSRKGSIEPEILKKSPYSPGTYILMMMMSGKDANNEELIKLAEQFGLNINIDCPEFIADFICGINYTIDEAKCIDETFDILFKEKEQIEEYENFLYMHTLDVMASNNDSLELFKEFCLEMTNFDAAIPKRGIIRRYRERVVEPTILEVEKALNDKGRRSSEDIDDISLGLKRLRVIAKFIMPDIGEKVEVLWNQYAYIFAEKVIEGIDFSDVSEVVKRHEEIKEVDDCLMTCGAGQYFKENLSTYIKKKTENCTTNELVELKKYVKELSDVLKYDFQSDFAYIENRESQLELESRTVLGIVYATQEEANQEKKKVVNNLKYETEEEATIVREKFEREKQIEEEEIVFISSVEANNSSIANKLVELRKREYKSESAIRKVEEFETKVKKLYEEYSETKNSGKYKRAKLKKALYLLLAIIGVVLTIVFWGSIRSVGKIIFVLITMYFLGVMFEEEEKIKTIEEELKELERLERVMENE